MWRADGFISIPTGKLYFRCEECTRMKLSLVPLLAAISFSSSLFAQKDPPLPGPRKIQVLIITGRDDHDWRGVTPLMRQYLDDAGIFETRIAEEFRDVGPDGFKGYDVAVLVYSDKKPEDRWTDRTRQLLLDFVHSGKGLVV